MSAFESQYGESAPVRVIAPGRINLIGEHIDYLGGKVMPIAINRHLTVEAAPSNSGVVEIMPEGMDFTAPALIDLKSLERRTKPSESWMNYVIGVLSVYRDAGIQIPAFKATISSDLPTGAGLSSSAALETAIALVVEALSGVEQDVVDRALLCQRAEHEFAGVPCGIMDQLAVGAGKKGHALLLNCADLSTRQIPLPPELAIVTTDTRVKHALGDGEYKRRREDCDEILRRLDLNSFDELRKAGLETRIGELDEKLSRRARHAVSEFERVDQFAGALQSSDREALARLMRASHDSLRLDYEVSCPELDYLVASAYDLPEEFGVVGSRMTGGGFGGSTVTFVARDSAGAFCERQKKSFEEKFGRSPDSFITSAVDGAGVHAL
ncbi:MAG: galactokinase [Verrucomicrobiales bacterium]|nr:galactokinase [Verrucomicrobiales bacterium]